MTTTRLPSFTAIDNNFVQKHYRRDAYRNKKGYVIAPLVISFILLSAHAYFVTLPTSSLESPSIQASGSNANHTAGVAVTLRTIAQPELSTAPTPTPVAAPADSAACSVIEVVALTVPEIADTVAILTNTALTAILVAQDT